MNLVDALFMAAGVVVVLTTFASVTATLVVPRARGSRLARFVSHSIVRRIFLTASRFTPSYESKDQILSLSGPVSLLAMLAAWLLLLVVGFALMFRGVDDVAIDTAVRASGSSVFTLGFVAVVGATSTSIAFIAAASGLVVVALQIAYLPTIYDAFSRRETLVTLLQSRAGSPAWGPELLWRHHRVGIVDSLPDLYDDWEEWAADVAETHTTYPVLIFMRSPDPYRSWVTALLAVLDSAAMYLALCPDAAPSRARLVLRMGFTAWRDLAVLSGMAVDIDPRPDAALRLTYDEFAEAVDMLATAGFPLERTAEEAWPDFRGWRVNYEATAYAFAEVTVAPPALWSGPRTHYSGAPLSPQRPADRRPDRLEG